MAIVAPFRATALAGDTVDQLVWRELGLGSPAVEQVLAANPGLADLGVMLPEGTTVLIPSVEATSPAVNTVNLWD